MPLDRQHRPRDRRGRAVWWSCWRFVLFASVVAAFLGVFAYGLSGVQEHRSQQQLYAQFRGLLAPASLVAPSIGGAIAAGTPVALLSAPAAGIHDVVVDRGHLVGRSPPRSRAPCRHPAARTGRRGGPGGQEHDGRRTLRATWPGSAGAIRLRCAPARACSASPCAGRIPPGTHQQAIPANQGRLVLVTSAGAGGVGGPGALPDGRRRGHAAQARPSLRRRTGPRPWRYPNVPGQSDPAAWPFVGLWLAGLAVASAAVWWLWSRWGILRAWIIGAPVLLALLWGLSNEAMRLLPNVY